MEEGGAANGSSVDAAVAAVYSKHLCIKRITGTERHSQLFSVDNMLLLRVHVNRTVKTTEGETKPQ